MKLKNKIVALFLTVACAFGLAVANNAQRVEAADSTITFDNTSKRTTFTTSQQVWEENGITVTNDKASSSSNVADYAAPARFYKGSKVTVTVADTLSIDKIVFDCNKADYATALKNSISGDATVSSDKVTVLGNGTNEYVIENLSGGQVRMDSITVTTSEVGAAPKTDAEVLADIMEVFTIDTEYLYDSNLPLDYKEATISWSSNNNALAINGDLADVTRGDTDVVVKLTAVFTYEGENETVTGTKEIDVVVKALNPNEPVVGTTYKLAVDQKALGTTIYFTGVKSGYNLEVSNSLSDAADIVFEDAIGGLYYSVNVGGSKKYLNLVASGIYGNIYLDDDPSTVWKYNDQYNTMTATLSNGTFFLGTYNTNNDIRSSSISYASNSNNYLGYFVEASGITVEDQFESLNTMVQFGIDYATTEKPVSGASFYELVTDASELTDGDTIIIVSSDEGYALSTNQKTNNRGHAIVVKEDDKINSIGEDVQVITLEDAGEGNFAFNVGEGYLYAASSSSNYLKTQETNDANGYWKITIEEGVTSIVAQGSNTRNVLQYNASSDLFACYASVQKQVSIYKLTSGSLIQTSYSFNNAKLRFVGIIPAELTEYVNIEAGAGVVLTLPDGKKQTVYVPEENIVTEADGSLRFAVVLNVPAEQYDTVVTGQAFVYLHDATEATYLAEKAFSVNSIVEYYLGGNVTLTDTQVAVLKAFQAA